MAPPLYFLPGVRLEEFVQDGRPAAALLKRYGLDGVLADIELTSALSMQDTTGAGPSGSSGVLFCTNTAGQPPHRFGYLPEFQRWQKVCNQPELWIGVDKEHPAGPNDLRRVRLLDGHPVTLADGNEYLVPYVRSLEGRTALPRDMYHDADGKFVQEIQPAYQGIWEVTARLWDMVYGQDEAARLMDYEEALGYCLDVLGLNYRYGKHEQAVLRLVDTTSDTWERIFEAVVDVPFTQQVLAEQKKTEPPAAPATPSTPPGSGD